MSRAVRTRAVKSDAPAAPSKSEQTRQRILDSAAIVLAERGYTHTRLSDVARQAGSHAGGIYYYFESREALVEELLRVCTEHALSELRAALAALPADATSEEKIVAAARSQLAGIMSNDPYILAYNKIFLQVPEDVQIRHREILRSFFAIWRDLIREGQANGEIRVDLSPAVIRLTISGAIQWAVQWASARHGTADELARQMVDLLLHGALSRQAGAPAGPA